MTNKLLHPRKAHLIEHITDDVRALHQNNVDLQRTLFTGRALKDVLSGDTVNSGDEHDAKYFNGDAFDFDKMFDPSIRYIQGGNGAYTHGPLEGAVNQKTCGAMLHTLTVLPDGKLSYEGDTDGERPGAATSVRQIFYPDDPLDLDAYTRVGTWNPTTKTYDWSGWISLSGRPLRILVWEDPNDPTAYDRVANLLKRDSLLPYVIYELHCGGHTINLPSADGLYLATNIAFEQYANTNYSYTQVDRSQVTSPDPRQKYYTRTGSDSSGWTYQREGNNGFISTFESGKTYFTRDPIAQWTNTISYTEKVKDHADGVIKEVTYSTELVPGIDTTRADTYDSGLEDGAIYEDAHTAILYKFEVINRETPLTISAGVTSTRTWMLDAQPEAIDALEGFAELLNAHTDMKVDDIIQYDKRGFKGDNTEGFTPQQIAAFDVNESGGTLVITHPTNMRGVAKITFSLGASGSLSSGFKASIYKFNESDSNFNPKGVSINFTETTDTTPNPYKKYYTYNEASGYSLAEGTGYPLVFQSSEKYYTKVFTPADGLKVARCKTSVDFGTDASTPYRAAVFGEDGDAKSVVAYDGGTYSTIPRGDIKSTPNTVFMDVYRNDVIMVVINSTHHDADKKVISLTVEIYPDPHDSYVSKLDVNESAFIGRDLNKLPFPGLADKSLASSKSLIDAYTMIVSKLQPKGLLYGRRVISGNLDSVTAPGVYTITDNSVASSSAAAAHKSTGTMFTNGTLIVFNTQEQGGPAALKSDEIITRSAVQVSQLIFGYKSPVTASVPSVGEIWYRTKPNGKSFTPWIRLGMTPSISSTEVAGNVSASDVETLLAAGDAVVIVTGSSEATTRVVTLPDPRYHKGARMQVEAINCKVDITYKDPTSTSTTDPEYITYHGTNVRGGTDRVLYPLECDGEYWYVITVS